MIRSFAPIFGFASFLLLAGVDTAQAQTLLQRLHADPTAMQFGMSVDFAGDMDGDGFDDLVVGAPASAPSTGGMGAVEVFSGATGARLYSFPGRSLGNAVAGAGDVNGDGYADIVCGATASSEFTPGGGAVFVYSGLNGQILYQWNGSAGQRMGAQVAGGGDVNADGYDDVIVSYGTSAMGYGGTNVFSGATGAILHSFRGYAGSSSSGSGVSFAGDVNADGHSDIIVGGYNSGRADVYSGADGSVLHATGGPTTFGGAVSGIGDIDNDGHDDFVVGSTGGWTIGLGKAYVYSGLTGQRIYIFEGDFYFDDFGGAVSGAGDVDGDGVPDIAVSAQGFGINNAHNRGYIRLYSGATGAVLYAISGSFSFRYFGRSMRAGGDINGDGIGDVIAGAHLDGGTGKAYVFSHTFDGSETVCVGHSHSGGLPTRLVAESQSGFDASLNDTVLRVENLPGGAHAMAMIIGSPGYGVVHYPAPGGMQSDGVLCISGGPIGRFNRPGQVHFGMPGYFSLPLDLNEIPWTDPNSAPAYSATLLAGDTWYFQCWYRDVHSHSDPAVTGESNFSDAIRITFK